MSLLFGMTALANDLILSLEVGGALDARFRGLEILADIHAGAALSGEVKMAATRWEIEAAGSLLGFGRRDILTTTSTGWFILSAEGVLNTGGAWTIRSLLYGARRSTTPLRAGDSLEGIHVTLTEMSDEAAVFVGAFSGTLGGGAVPSGTIGVIRLEGAGTFHLVGDRADATAVAAIPLDEPSIPDEVLRSIREFTKALPG